MYAVILEGMPEFLKDAERELIAKGFRKISENVYVVNAISNFDNIVRGPKDLQSYKKSSSKNHIYKTSTLIKI